VVAANRLLRHPVPVEQLLPHAVAGEQVASGAAHADNAAPCLLGGMLAVVASDPPRVVRIPVPAAVRAVIVRPRMRLDTRAARAVLPERLPLERHVEQSKRLAGFLAGCFANDLALIGRSMEDLVAEPARSPLIPGFDAARRAALAQGALGFGIAGAGPSVFAWVASDGEAERVAAGVREAFERAGLRADAWCGPISRRGAFVERAE
jgi:homoserine kinase